MHPPPGFKLPTSTSKLVCKLNKAIYGLKQAPCAWFERLKTTLKLTGFLASRADASLFVKISPTYVLYVLIYVDDILITGSCQVKFRG